MIVDASRKGFLVSFAECLENIAKTNEWRAMTKQYNKKKELKDEVVRVYIVFVSRFLLKKCLEYPDVHGIRLDIVMHTPPFQNILPRWESVEKMPLI